MMALVALAFAGLLVFIVIDVERRGRQWEAENDDQPHY